MEESQLNVDKILNYLRYLSFAGNVLELKIVPMTRVSIIWQR